MAAIVGYRGWDYPRYARIGNGCGHIPSKPLQYIEPAHHQDRPELLEAIKQKLIQYYWQCKNYLPNLNYIWENGEERQKRTERREAIMLVAQSLVQYVELWSLRVGIPCNNGDFNNLSYEYILNDINRGLRDDEKLTLKRVRNALQDLKAAGYIKIKHQREQASKGKFKGLPSIIEICRVFFIHLGVSFEKLTRLREWKESKLKKLSETAKRWYLKLKGIFVPEKKKKKPRVRTDNQLDIRRETDFMIQARVEREEHYRKKYYPNLPTKDYYILKRQGNLPPPS
jgi:hypothetical protein